MADSATTTKTKTGQVMQALLDGESLAAKEVADRWDSSSTLLYSVVKRMEHEGYPMVKTDDGEVTRWRVGAKTNGHSNGNGSAAPTPVELTGPTIGEALTVVALTLDDDGKTIVHTLRDEAGSDYDVVFP